MRSTIASIRSCGSSSVIGMPDTVEYRASGTIASPWPPSTKAVVFSTETPSSMAMKARMRAESRTPAMPTTRRFQKPETSSATWHMASSGLETTTMIASGESLTALRVHSLTILLFVVSRSSRLIPGLRAMPAAITTTSDPAVSA